MIKLFEKDLGAMNTDHRTILLIQFFIGKNAK